MIVAGEINKVCRLSGCYVIGEKLMLIKLNEKVKQSIN